MRIIKLDPFNVAYLHREVKDYDTKDLTLILKRKRGEGASGTFFCAKKQMPGEKTRVKQYGKCFKLPLIVIRIGKNKFPLKGEDHIGTALKLKNERELILFVFWHEFLHYLDWKLGRKTKHREISQLAYNYVRKKANNVRDCSELV